MVSLILGAATLAGCSSPSDNETKISELTTVQNCQYANVYGRTFYNEKLDGTTIVNSASGFEVRFYGTELKVKACVSVGGATGYTKSMFSVFVDGETDCNARIVGLKPTSGLFITVTLASGLPEGEHTVKVLKRTPSNRDSCAFRTLTTDGYFLDAPEKPELKIDIYGDSITCGEGVLRSVTYNEATGKYDDSAVYTADTQNVFQSYAGVAMQTLGADYQVFGRGGISMKYKYANTEFCVLDNYKSIAVDLSVERGECPEYDFGSRTPDAVVIYLGTNDYFSRTTSDFSMAGLTEAFASFINGAIGSYYGKDMPILLCSGMMAVGSGLEGCMESVRSALQSQYPNLETLQFSPCKAGHPVADESAVAGGALAQKLTEMLDL